MKKVDRVAIVGAGNGGVTAALDFSQRGFSVALTELPAFAGNLARLKEHPKLVLMENGKESFSGQIDTISEDIGAVLRNADIVVISLPGEHTEKFAQLVAPHIEENQCVLFMGASAMCSVRFRKAATDAGVTTKMRFGEFNTLPYATRVNFDTGIVSLSLRVQELAFASLPAGANQELYELVSQLYPNVIQQLNDTWENLLNNTNLDVHPAPALLSAARVEFSKGEFYLYREGITEHRDKVMVAVDQERIKLGKVLGYTLEPLIEGRIRRKYLIPDHSKPVYKWYNESPAFHPIKGPSDLESRYYSEENAGPLALMLDMGEVLGVDLPVCRSIVTLAGTLLDKNFREEGLSLLKLGINTRDKQSLLKIVKE